MRKFWDLLERSVIVQCTMPILFGVTCIVLWLRGDSVPDELMHLTWAVVSFWMGTKVQHQIDRDYTKGLKGKLHDLRVPGSK